MIRIRVLIAPVALAAAILACAAPTAPLAPSTLEPVSTVVAKTMQAILTSSPAAAPTATLAPLATPTPTAVLPHSLYFLNKDDGGVTQVFRLEVDGHTVRQITFELMPVDAFAVAPAGGSVAYTSNNQLFLADATGAGRRMVLDGGPVDDNNRWTNTVGAPVWSPDGQTLAFSHGGLNFLSIGTGSIDRTLENQVSTTAGFPMVNELYAPNAYSPDGSQLLINITFFEAGTFGIYLPSNDALIRLKRPEGGIVCCHVNWIPDGSGLYVSSPTLGMNDSGLYFADAATGSVTTLLPGSPADGTYNFADAPQVGPDGRLYFFFNNLPAIPTSSHTPLFLVRSSSDGVTGRTQLLPEPFQNANEILWAPDASLAVLVTADQDQVAAGGQVQIIYPDGRPAVKLVQFARAIRWGP
jgi:WD40 repeat protein